MADEIILVLECGNSVHRGVWFYFLCLIEFVVWFYFFDAWKLPHEKQFHLGNPSRCAQSELVFAQRRIWGDGRERGDVLGIHDLDVAKGNARLVADDLLGVIDAFTVEVHHNFRATLPTARHDGAQLRREAAGRKNPQQPESEER